MEEIKRDRYLKQLIDSQQNGFIKVITGIRRCGKSYLLNVLFYHYLLDNGVAKDHIMPRRNKEGILTIGRFDFLLKKTVWIYSL